MDSSLDLRSVSLADLVSTYINSAADLLESGDQLLPGDRIEAFFALAANRPDVAFPAFVTILRDIADPNYRALALRSLGRIEHPATLQEIRECETESSQELVQMLASELLGRGQYSNDLTRWAAADAITYLQYAANILRGTALGGLMERPERIQQEITEHWLFKKDHLRRFNSQSKPTVEYERFLEFWTFGPTEQIFLESNLDSKDIENLLMNLSFRGLFQALCREDNNAILMRFAYSVFQSHCRSYVTSEFNDQIREQGLQRFINLDSVTVEKIGIKGAVRRLAKIAARRPLGNLPEKLLSKTFHELEEAESEGENWLQAIKEDKDQVAAILAINDVNTSNGIDTPIYLKQMISDMLDDLSDEIRSKWLADIDDKLLFFEKLAGWLDSYRSALYKYWEFVVELTPNLLESEHVEKIKLSCTSIGTADQMTRCAFDEDLLILRGTEFELLGRSNWHEWSDQQKHQVSEVHKLLLRALNETYFHATKELTKKYREYLNVIAKAFHLTNTSFSKLFKKTDRAYWWTEGDKLYSVGLFFLYPPYTAKFSVKHAIKLIKYHMDSFAGLYLLIPLISALIPFWMLALQCYVLLYFVPSLVITEWSGREILSNLATFMFCIILFAGAIANAVEAMIEIEISAIQSKQVDLKRKLEDELHSMYGHVLSVSQSKPRL